MFWILQMKLKFDPILKMWEKYFHLHLRVHYFILILFSSLRQNLNLYSAIHRSLDKDSHSFTEYLTAI